MTVVEVNMDAGAAVRDSGQIEVVDVTLLGLPPFEVEVELEVAAADEAEVAVEPSSPMPRPALNDTAARVLRSENETLRRRIGDLQLQLADSEELRLEGLHAAAALDVEMARLAADAATAAASLHAAHESLAARDRRAAQADQELAKLGAQCDRLRLDLAEMARQRDALCAKANLAVHDAEQLREVIRHQAALLEERRVEIMVLEARARLRS